MAHIENVVYRTVPDDTRPDHQPSVSYRSMPGRCSGSAETLAQARATFRAELTRLLDVERYDLPPVVEHVEAKVSGIWVRSKVGAVHRDRLTDRMFLQRLLAPGELQDQVRAYLGHAAGHGVEAVVVLAEPEDPVAAVLDQMAPGDAVVVTYPHDRDGLGWTAIHGPESAAPGELPVARLDAGLRDCPIEEFVETCVAAHHQRAVRLDETDLPQAC